MSPYSYLGEYLWDGLHVLAPLVFTVLVIGLSVCLPVFRQGPRKNPHPDKPLSTMVVWGSGGHTAEMLRLLQTMNTSKFSPWYFVLADTDKHSAAKIEKWSHRLPKGMLLNVEWLRIPRAREVKQSWITSFFTSAWASFYCFFIVLHKRPQNILCNGPGTCIPICLSAFLLRIVGICDPLIIFCESWCRVSNLSLSGRILYYIADKFVVHWPELAEKYPRAEYLGRLFH